MGAPILAGSALIAGAETGQLGQYYGLADTIQTTVTNTGLQSLSSIYTIPANEAYAGAAYELLCGGTAIWGTASEHLELTAQLNTTPLHITVIINDSCFASGSTQVWNAWLRLVCADGVSEWLGSWGIIINQVANNIIPGTAANNTVPAGDSAPSAVTALTSAPITVAMMASWSGASTAAIYNDWTMFRKVS